MYRQHEQTESGGGDAVAHVVAVSASATHSMSKKNRSVIRLMTGRGVDGDTHRGVTVQHRSRVARDPTQPNLRQVHLLPQEILDDLGHRGFVLRAGEIGENITTRGIDLLGLPAGTRLRFGGGAEVELSGLRNPCRQLDGLQNGLMGALIGRGVAGELLRFGGVMAVVTADGEVRSGTSIALALPAAPHEPLRPV